VANNLEQVTDAELMGKFNATLTRVRQEITAVKAQYANTPGPHLTEDDWSFVEQEARSYVWLYLCCRGVGAPTLVPGTVVEIAIWRAQQVQAAGGTEALMEKFNRVLDGFNAAVKEIQAADPTLPVDELIAKAERRAALQHPLDAPISWFGKTPQVN
jgi:hypothetical protein